MSNTSGRITDLQTNIEFPQAEKWLKRTKINSSVTNAKHKRIALEQFDEFLQDEGINELEDVDDMVMDSFTYYLVGDLGLAHSTVMGKWYDVRQYLNENIDDMEDDDLGVGYIDENDSRFKYDYLLEWLDNSSEKSKQNDSDIHWISLDDIRRLIDGAKNFKNEMVIRCLVNFGCRPIELSRIKLSNHNPDTRSFRIQSAKIDDADHPLYTRSVFYSRNMRKYMDEWLNQGGREAYSHAEESDYLIVGYNTPSIGSQQINEIVKMAADEAGIQEDAITTASGVDVNAVTARTLRHSFAVHSVRGRKRTGSESMDVERLRRIMGHTTIESSRDYLQFTDVELRDAFDNSMPNGF